MKLNTIRSLLCLLVCSSLVACTTIEEKRKIDYRGATRTLPPLEVPPDLSAVPETNAPGGAPSTYSAFVGDKKTAVAGNSSPGVLPVASDMRIERDGQTRWLVVDSSAENLWPRVREFVSSVGLIIDRENPSTGMIETDWAENRAKVGTGGQMLLAKWLGGLYSTGTRDKFRIRLERGARPGTTEVYIAHQGMEEMLVENSSSSGGTRWQLRPSEPDIETEMMRLLIVHLGKTEVQSKTILAQAPPPPGERARLARENGNVLLNLDDSPDRAWRRVGLSLDRTGFTVEDRDRSKGVYYVRYIDPDKPSDRPGFFARLFGAEDKKDSEQYQIHLQAAGVGTAVAVRNKEGVPESSKTGERILTLLQEQLK